MKNERQTDYEIQRKLVLALRASMRCQAASVSVELVETHISWVLLVGHYAYKIKKAIALDFLDFSNLDARHYYCQEEIRLNRRLAPGIYLDVLPIGGHSENPVLGAQPAIEYAVRMRRFDVSMQLDRLVASNNLLPQHIDSLAADIALFHGSLPAAPKPSSFGTAGAIREDAEQNFKQLQDLLTEQFDIDNLAALHRASDSEFARCFRLFEWRQEAGYVRECHGDLHLGNIVLLDEQPIPFDGIEFNPALRWIDVISEVAFTVMDLMHYLRADLAYRFLNAYVEATGDYAGISLLRFYVAYRAMVRAKVSAIRASQGGLNRGDAARESDNCRGYLQLAADSFAPRQEALIITHGLPGSGKTTFSQMALERLQAIRLRSDVERKRLFGLAPLAHSQASMGIDLYATDMTQRTYVRLHELAHALLLAGYRVIVDAAFLQQEERDRFRQLANELSVPFAIASLRADADTLRARIVQRQQAATDASEADIAVLEKLQLSQQPLLPSELVNTVEFNNEGPGFALDAAGWSSLNHLLSRAI